MFSAVLKILGFLARWVFIYLCCTFNIQKLKKLNFEG